MFLAGLTKVCVRRSCFEKVILYYGWCEKRKTFPFSFCLFEQNKTMWWWSVLYVLGGGAGRGREGAFDLMTWFDLAGLTPPSFIAGIEGEGLTGRWGCVERKNNNIYLLVSSSAFQRVSQVVCVHARFYFCFVLLTGRTQPFHLASCLSQSTLYSPQKCTDYWTLLSGVCMQKTGLQMCYLPSNKL